VVIYQYRKNFLVVDDKIKEAEYFLDKVKSSPFDNELYYLVSAFLTSTRSIPDYLLEDYNIKFGLNIPLTDRLYPWTFEREAKLQNNLVALSFLDDYNKEFSNLNSDPIVNGMLNKRNIKVHRRKVDSLLHAEIETEETLYLSDKSSVVMYDLNGNVIGRSESETNQGDNNPRKSNGPKKETVKWYFSEYPTIEAYKICEKFLDSVKSFKNSIVTKYP
jgi:hypothetical protein